MKPYGTSEGQRSKGGRAPLFGTDFHAWQFCYDEIFTKLNETSGNLVKRYRTSENIRDKGGRAPFLEQSEKTRARDQFIVRAQAPLFQSFELQGQKGAHNGVRPPF